MTRVKTVVLFAMAAAFIAMAVPATAETAFPTGSRVGMVPPQGMTPSKRFPGFEDADRKVAITIMDLPAAAYESLERSAFAEGQTGVEQAKRESFPFENGIGILVSGVVEQNGEKVHKWFLMSAAVTGPVRDLAMLVIVQVPEAALSVYSEDKIRAALRSVTFRPPPFEEQLAMMPFKFEDMAGFRVVQVLKSGGVILVDGPDDDINVNPYVIVSIGRNPPADDDRSRFANDMLSQAPLRALKVQTSEPMRISNGPGHEIRAQAEALNGSPVKLVQWVRFGGNGFLRIIGVAGDDKWDAMFNRFRALRDGIDVR